MNPADVENLVFTGVARAPLGTVLLSSLDQSEIEEAAKGFFALLFRDPQLSAHLNAQKSYTVASLNEVVKGSIESGRPLDLADWTRRVLVILAHLIIAGGLFPERPSDLESLGEIVKSRPHIPDIPQAAECLLNAADRCKDPRVKIAAGRYYLEIFDAEVGTALAYFASATELDSSYPLVRGCDNLVEQFVKTRAIFYPFNALKPYLDEWEDHKRKL
jgi:hypothetical protein